MLKTDTTIQSAVVLIPLFFIYLIGASLLMSKAREKMTFFKLITIVSLGVYIMSVLHLTLFPITVHSNLAPWLSALNWIPILTIDIKTFMLNIIMFVPLGVYFYLAFSHEKTIKQVAVYSLVGSVLLESTQLVIRIVLASGRSVDVNDLIANTLGGIVGYYILKKMTSLSFFQTLIQRFSLA